MCVGHSTPRVYGKGLNNEEGEETGVLRQKPLTMSPRKCGVLSLKKFPSKTLTCSPMLVACWQNGLANACLDMYPCIKVLKSLIYKTLHVHFIQMSLVSLISVVIVFLYKV